ncbi:MAG TPA: protein kinase [Kofleriaceae bacterium]
MGDDKRTKLGTAPVGVVAAPAMTPAPSSVDPHPTSFLPPAPPEVDVLLGQTLAGRYIIDRKLGEGGMGAVYLATHNVLEKQVALKILHSELSRKPDLVERFIQEAKSASRIRHENVINISDFGSTPEGVVFFAMELLKGHDLHEVVTRARLAGQLLPWERSKKIFLQICAALVAAHGLGIVHRDLKPENIYLVEFLGEPDFVKLLDFGIAKVTDVGEGDRKLTRTGMLFGTPEYMSPEQARGDTVDHRVDVYAMGCILFQLVTGRVPFEAENFMGVLSLHLTEPPPVIPTDIFDSIGAPRGLAQVIDRALAKDRNQRFGSIEELVRAVRAASGDKLTAPVLAASVPAPKSTGAMGRARTQWTGNLSVPEVDAVAPRAPGASSSKLPMIIGAIVLAAGAAAAAALVATRGHGDGPGSAGSAAVLGAGSASGAPVVPPVPPPVQGAGSGSATVAQPPPAFDFAQSQLRLESQPAGAEVVDVASGKLIGRTPITLKVAPSHDGRQFEIRARGYVSSVVELVPDKASVGVNEKLEKGSGHKLVPAASKPAADPAAKPEPATEPVTRPGPEPEAKLPEVKPPEAKPEVKPDTRPKPDDDDMIQLKQDPSRAGSGTP